MTKQLLTFYHCQCSSFVGQGLGVDEEILQLEKVGWTFTVRNSIQLLLGSCITGDFVCLTGSAGIEWAPQEKTDQEIQCVE